MEDPSVHWLRATIGHYEEGITFVYAQVRGQPLLHLFTWAFMATCELPDITPLHALWPSAAALPYVKSCVFSVFLMYVMSGIGDIFENVCWWCIYQEVHFLIVDNNCWCFPQNLVKRTRCWGASPVAGSSNHHEDNSELKEWWRIPDPHFVYLCPMVPPVPHFVWVASLSVNLNGITDYDKILDLTL